MDQSEFSDFFAPRSWYLAGLGSRYLQLSRHIEKAIRDRHLAVGSQLPPERDVAQMSDVSRVTIRKAVGRLVELGLIEQQQGSGSFVSDFPTEPRLEQSLSNLTSFTEYMERRGLKSTSQILMCGLYPPTPDEMVALGIRADEISARIRRLRSADGAPLAVESSMLPLDILPDPGVVETSLYQVLRARNCAPVRAIQRIAAANLSSRDAGLLHLPVGTAVLQIDRTGYLPSGRPIEFTRGIYRSDVYDFVSELRLDGR